MIKRILITGDDGYNSVGIRALSRLLRDDYSLNIVATLKQQSGTGGKINLSDELPWGEDSVEGVPALWVDGSPVDAIEVAQGYFKKPFDLAISGINLGENLTYALVSSGTFSAAVRVLGVGLAPKALALSWKTTGDNFLRNHDISENISEFLEYPGKEAIKTIKLIIENNFYNKELVNVNFPYEKSNKYKIAKVAKDITKLWTYPVIIDRERKIAKKPIHANSNNLETDESTDVWALNNNYITISPIDYLSSGS